uniref:Uncharacterized protein n=1 Tax=Oryza glumipatula TaxID=40148 RepID=A0A0E0BSF2_9ORYZ
MPSSARRCAPRPPPPLTSPRGAAATSRCSPVAPPLFPRTSLRPAPLSPPPPTSPRSMAAPIRHRPYPTSSLARLAPPPTLSSSSSIHRRPICPRADPSLAPSPIHRHQVATPIAAVASPDAPVRPVPSNDTTSKSRKCNP